MMTALQRFESIVSFTCPECQTHVTTTVEVPEPDWSAIESTSDMEGIGAYDLTCPICRTDFETTVANSGGIVEVVIVDHPSVSIDAGTPFFSPEIPYQEDPPEDPYGRFMEATNQIKEVMDKQGSELDGAHMVNRMVFAQYISAFEAYLAETLVKNVEADQKAVRKLIVEDKNLHSRKFDLISIINDPDIVNREVRSYLRGIVYHRLDQVNSLYYQSLGIRILKEKAESDALIQAVKYRHDCVHRNGFDIDGANLQVFTPSYIEEIAAILIEIVGRVQAAILFKDVVRLDGPM